MDRIEHENNSAAAGTTSPPRTHSPPQRIFLRIPSPEVRGGSPASTRRRSRQPSIRIRRLSSSSSFERQSVDEDVSVSQNSQPSQLQIPSHHEQNATPALFIRTEQHDPASGLPLDYEVVQANRRRSSSEPHRGRFTSLPLVTVNPPEVPVMSPVTEETASQTRPSMDLNNVERLPSLLRPTSSVVAGEPLPPDSGVGGRRSILRRSSRAALSAIGRNRASTTAVVPTDRKSLARDEYDSRIVDLLDVVDPEVSTLSTLTNVQNSLFVPDLGFLNRQPTYTLTRHPTGPKSETSKNSKTTMISEDGGRHHSGTSDQLFRKYSSIGSALGDDAPFAILPDGATLAGWTIADVEELNDHVRHMLHSRRSKFKRAMRGFGQYVSKPLGFLVTLYATLITLFGLAWVLFLIGWINVGGKQLYVINVIDNVLVALFAVMGDGLAPFRAVDTYHMIYIAHYHHLTWKLRKKRRLPKLNNKNDLPSRGPPGELDLESYGEGGNPGFQMHDRTTSDGDKIEKQDSYEFSVLGVAQQRKLEHHSQKFSKSHTFYKPHETDTHFAFPLQLLIAIVVLLDFHSIFQIALGTCTWAISYHVRPFALTTVILCCSITCNITAGVLIMVGDRRTRKTEVVKRMFRQQLTQEAMKKMEKRRKRGEQTER